MLIIYNEIVLDRYLLVLAPGKASEASLAEHLDRACRSNTPAVWVDCRLLDTVSATTAWLLWACQQRLRRRHVRLVLCRVSRCLEDTLRQVLPNADLHVVPTLD